MNHQTLKRTSNQIRTVNCTGCREINIKYERWIIQVTHNIQSFLFMWTTSVYTLYILEQLFLEAPRQYVHCGLVLGLDWVSCQPPSILYLLCLSSPTQQLVVCSNDSYFTRVPSLNPLYPTPHDRVSNIWKIPEIQIILWYAPNFCQRPHRTCCTL